MVTLLLHTQLDGKRMEVGKAIEKVALKSTTRSKKLAKTNKRAFDIPKNLEKQL
jgi:hypothetical protein